LPLNFLLNWLYLYGMGSLRDAFSLLLCPSGIRFSLSLFSHMRRQSSLPPPCNADFAAAAPRSLIVAAFVPIRWLFLCLPPLVVAQNSHIGGASRLCRRALRRQVGESSPIVPIVPILHPPLFSLAQQFSLNCCCATPCRNNYACLLREIYPFLRFRRSCQAPIAAQPAPTTGNNRNYCTILSFTQNSLLITVLTLHSLSATMRLKRKDIDDG
jgi:hypothetical protein